MIRLALVGDDEHALRYAGAAPRLVNATFAAVADSDADRARRSARLLGAPIAADNLDDLLTKHCDAIDAVLIHRPQLSGCSDFGPANDAQAATCRRAANSGKHLLVESPIALSTEAADSIVDACDATGVRLMVGQSSRFLPAVQTIRQVLTARKLGEPGLLRIHRWAPRSVDGGFLFREMTREIDLANWLFGQPPRAVYAVVRNQSNSQSGAWDCVLIHLGFEGGGMALIDCAATLPGEADYFAISLIGSTGAAYADDHHNMQLLYRGDAPLALKTRQDRGDLLWQLQEFVNAIQERRIPAICGADGRLAVQVAEVAAESVVEQRAARLTKGRYEFL